MGLILDDEDGLGFLASFNQRRLSADTLPRSNADQPPAALSQGRVVKKDSRVEDLLGAEDDDFFKEFDLGDDDLDLPAHAAGPDPASPTANSLKKPAAGPGQQQPAAAAADAPVSKAPPTANSPEAQEEDIPLPLDGEAACTEAVNVSPQPSTADALNSGIQAASLDEPHAIAASTAAPAPAAPAPTLRSKEHVQQPAASSSKKPPLFKFGADAKTPAAKSAAGNALLSRLQGLALRPPHATQTSQPSGAAAASSAAQAAAAEKSPLLQSSVSRSAAQPQPPATQVLRPQAAADMVTPDARIQVEQPGRPLKPAASHHRPTSLGAAPVNSTPKAQQPASHQSIAAKRSLASPLDKAPGFPGFAASPAGEAAANSGGGNALPCAAVEDVMSTPAHGAGSGAGAEDAEEAPWTTHNTTQLEAAEVAAGAAQTPVLVQASAPALAHATDADMPAVAAAAAAALEAAAPAATAHVEAATDTVTAPAPAVTPPAVRAPAAVRAPTATAAAAAVAPAAVAPAAVAAAAVAAAAEEIEPAGVAALLCFDDAPDTRAPAHPAPKRMRQGDSVEGARKSRPAGVPQLMPTSYLGSKRALEVKIIETQQMQDDVVELRVQAAMASNRLVMVDNPIIRKNLKELAKIADRLSLSHK